jgi:hypothetical protein
MNHSMLFRCALLFLAFLSMRSPASAQTTVSGVVYKLTAGRGYGPLEGVSVIAIREDTGGLSTKPIKSGRDGRFQLGLPEGGPFVVLLYGNARVPQLQQYAGNHAKNMIHVTLYTPTEYSELHATGPSLESKYNSLLGEVQPYSEGYMVLLQYIYSLVLR